MSALFLRDAFMSSPQVVRARRLGGSDALAFFIAMLCWCGEQQTDGLVPYDMIGDIPGPKSARSRNRALRILEDVELIAIATDGSLQIVPGPNHRWGTR